MSMDPFMHDILKPISDMMANVFGPETYQALDRMPTLTPGLGDELNNNEVILTPDKFQINLDVANFKPEELAVKTTGNFITMEGKHEEKTDHSQVSRSFSRRWAIPEGVKVEELNCHLNSRDGILQLEAPRIPPRYKRLDHTYMIPIMVGKDRPASPSDSTKAQVDLEDLDKNVENMAKSEKMVE